MIDTGLAFQAAGAGDLPRLTRIDVEGLSRELSRVSRDDPYQLSPAYYVITGRKGLWRYGTARDAMLLARHPNRADRLLAFMPHSGNSQQLLKSLVNDPCRPPGELQLARLSENETRLLPLPWRAHVRTEDALDWVFPVHVLGTRRVSHHEGRSFHDFRKNLSRAAGLGLTSRPLEIARDATAIMRVARDWATQRAENAHEIADMLAPTQTALQLRNQLPIDGIVIEQNGMIRGYALWEETRPKHGLANGLTNACVVQGKGASEFLYLAMCRRLLQRGFEEICIGGSETAGLDAFKRKMCPVRSVSLGTVSRFSRSPEYTSGMAPARRPL